LIRAEARTAIFAWINWYNRRLDSSRTESEAAWSSRKGDPMARIMTVTEEDARGIRKLILRLAKRWYGYVPGLGKIVLVDLAMARRISGIYDHLMRKSSPMTRLQREMLAVVVNGHVNGAP
jgi:hypothetical protein